MKTEALEYKHAGSSLEAFIAWEKFKEKRPGILIFHAWQGRDEFVLEKAKWLAQLGYVGIAVDLYGKGILGGSAEENAKLMEPFIKDRKYLLDRMQIALKAAQSHSAVDAQKMAAIGFCFGGLCALDLARSGAFLEGVVSLHGRLTPPENVRNKRIQAKILVLHGHDDPMVPPEQVLAFEKEMTERGVDWQVHAYGRTQHAFTNPVANDPSMGTVYNPVAEKRALQATKTFLSEILYQA